jgi:serine/threonine protein kinase/Tol biopolymer transport system component
MMLRAGTTLGPYQIVDALGAGGMGEVYRARDTRLARDVAIKILPEAFTADRNRLERFEREARLLASLNHPHIATIYGVEERDGVRGLVLELVEGPTVADRIAAGPIALDEALAIADQIAEALDAAHQQGIIHRDLKPANIKVRADGTVKVLDFGLAKALDPMASATEVSHSPTLTSPAMTAHGVILGTAAYMSPEQARGHPVDRGADIWAFGCVLFEMLTGTRAFIGGDPTETIAAIVRGEPDWSRVPPRTPESIRRLLRRTLEKDRRRRLADVRDARLEIEEARSANPPPVPAPDRSPIRERMLWSAALVLLAIAAILVRPRAAWTPSHPAPTMRVEISTPATSDQVSLALSPDGEKLVFAASADTRPQLWLRMLATGVTRPLAGTDGGTFPFWSPDSRSIGFFTNEKLYRLDIDGGPPTILANAPIGAGGTWNANGVILYTPVPDAQIMRVGASDVRSIARESVFQPAATPSGGQRFPHFLPDGDHFIFYVAETRGVYIGALDGRTQRRLLDADAAAVFAPPDQILFVRQGALFAQTFDLTRFELTGEPSRLVDQFMRGDDIAAAPRSGAAALSASAAGQIAYRPGAQQRRQVIWFDRTGRELEAIGEPDTAYPMNVSLSRDGRRAALNRSIGGNTDVWLFEVERHALRRITFDPAPEIVPTWSPDGTALAFSRVISARRGFAPIVKPIAEAAAETALETQGTAIVLDWSSDGRFLLYRTNEPKTGWDLWAYPMQGDHKPLAVAATTFDERTAQFSPDTHWLAYESNESGRFEIYVQAFPSGADKSVVSTSGGSQPRWRADGKELFYVAADGRLMAVPVGSDGKRLALGSAVPLFRTRIESMVQGGISFAYAVSADGQRFLMSTFSEETAAPIALILNRKTP